MDHFTLGVRPEYVRLSSDADAGAVPAVVTQAQDIGTYWLLTARLGPQPDAPLLRARLGPDRAIPQVGQEVWLQVVGEHTCYYVNEELIA
jgi:glycerol transport system ATP-binding protein